jgi:hypothetical protein
VELMGIEPTASRVRCENDPRIANDSSNLGRQKTPENVRKRLILATCSQNSIAHDQVANLLEAACRRWLVGHDPRELRRALLGILAMLG